jgi:hypothetical protein
MVEIFDDGETGDTIHGARGVHEPVPTQPAPPFHQLGGETDVAPSALILYSRTSFWQVPPKNNVFLSSPQYSKLMPRANCGSLCFTLAAASSRVSLDTQISITFLTLTLWWSSFLSSQMCRYRSLNFLFVQVPAERCPRSPFSNVD